MSEWLDTHVINFIHRYSFPAYYFAQSGDPGHLQESDYWLDQHRTVWGQQPRGLYGADEHLRSGYTDPRQGFETCGFVEFGLSFCRQGWLTGSPGLADRYEDLMLNHFPASQTPDLKGLHYLTASNQPQLDAGLDHDYCNKGRQICYSPHIYRCCQHNVALGWPWYAQNLWQATPDNGLALWLYTACEVQARVGNRGAKAGVVCETTYPFDGKATLTVSAEEQAAFPLYLRVPGWCRGYSVALNGRPVDVQPRPGAYVRLEHGWRTGDRIEIDMPLEVSLTRWPRTGSVTVDRGPLSYSVAIEEEWRRCGGDDAWPEWEVYPASAWNYGLVLDAEDTADALRVSRCRQIDGQPWTIENAPVEITARGRKIPGWKLENNTVQELRRGPIRSDDPDEEVRLIPLGCARLRMSCLPLIGDGPGAREWV
jgi:hypothetical protein